MVNKKIRTIDVYKQAGAEMRLFKSVGRKLAEDISQVLPAQDTDSFLRILDRIGVICSRAEDNMFHDHPEISNDYLDVFYGDVSGEPRNDVDAEIIGKAKETADELFKRKTN